MIRVVDRVNKYLKCPARIIWLLNFYKIGHLIPDKLAISCIYKVRIGKKLNLSNPQTYNEKLQWLKLYDRRKEYVNMVDKYEAKKYAKRLIGEEYLIPTIGIWDSFDEIDFDKLPDRFVLKCTHDSGGLIICKDKARLDLDKAREKINWSLKRNYYWHGREWPYKYVKPRIIAEPYLEDSKTGELRDYKFFGFDGDVKALFVASDRQKSGEETKFDFFDSDYNHLVLINGHPNAVSIPEKPVSFEKMKELASVLSKGFPQMRVDFYEVNGRPFLGEITFSHWSGFTEFDPEKWDYTFGSWITLPKRENKYEKANR